MTGGAAEGSRARLSSARNFWTTGDGKTSMIRLMDSAAESVANGPIANMNDLLVARAPGVEVLPSMSVPFDEVNNPNFTRCLDLNP